MKAPTKKIRVLIAKTSLDGHWRGVATVASALRDAGMEVVYGGQLTAAQTVQAAQQEDVDVIGLNIGGRFAHVGEMLQMLREKGMNDRLVIAGGPLLEEDIPALKALGIAEVFPTGSNTKEIAAYILKHAPLR